MPKEIIPGANQVLLRRIDEAGDLHVIHRGANGKGYFIEGHYGVPESWRLTMPNYFFPITQEYMEEEFTLQGKQWNREATPDAAVEIKRDGKVFK